MRIGVARPTCAMSDRRLDLLERAAPDPTVGVEVRIASRPLPACAMAGRAVLRKGGAALGARKGQELRSLFDLLKRGRGELIVHAAARLPQGGHFGCDGAARTPVQDARRRAAKPVSY